MSNQVFNLPACFHFFSIITLLQFFPGPDLHAQNPSATVSGIVRNASGKAAIPYASVTFKKTSDSGFVAGVITNEEGRFQVNNIKPGEYRISISSSGYVSHTENLLVGILNTYYNLGNIELVAEEQSMNEVVVSSRKDAVSGKMDKKSYLVSANISQAGGSVLQVLKNLPGITATQDGKVELRGSDKVAILVDGRQTALTGFGGQSGLDNIPASSIERIEIINNPSARYDANGNAGIINIIYKKEKEEGFSGKAGMAAGLGALWVKKESLPGVREQYQATPKINPSVSLNYRKGRMNAYLQGDWLYTETLNKNEFADRYYDSGLVVHQQLMRNRNTHFLNSRAGADWSLDDRNSFTLSGLFGIEKIIDNGDQPFFNEDYTKQLRSWRFLEDELKTTVAATGTYQHRFSQPGHLMNVGFTYTFHREDEKYFFENIMPTFTGLDSFALISDEHVADLNADYVRPLKHGRFETGLKFRWRNIPTNMQFKPGVNSPLDTAAGGPATYREIIPAVYANYIYESRKYELEAGARVEYVDLLYTVNPNHNTYKSDGYTYIQPFPNMRLSYKINDHHKLSFFYNRRVDRPNEVDIRIFPKYDDAEVIKVGNPALKPQYTNTLELGYKTSFSRGSVYGAVYHRITNGTITRIITRVEPSPLIYAVFQNAGRSTNTGLELVWQHTWTDWFTMNANFNGYRNVLDSFSVENKYPVPTMYTSPRQSLASGNVKFNGMFKLPGKSEIQLTVIYLAPDLIPQGRVGSRFSVDAGYRKSVQKGKGEWFFNATDIFNTLRIKKSLTGNGFRFESIDYYETQVFRVGYAYKFP